LYKYVQNQATYATYRGLHFTFVTDDSPTRALDFSKIKVGDIIFADWGYHTYTVDEYIDHVMIVTQKTGNSYEGIKVTYQSGGGNINYLSRHMDNLRRTWDSTTNEQCILRV